MSFVPVPEGVLIERDDDSIYGHIYVACQWGHCLACEPYPPYAPPEGWDTHRGDWFCPEHLSMARYEDGLNEIEWTIGIPQCFGRTLLRHRRGSRAAAFIVREEVV